jgi:hypothetical protein
MAMWQQIRNSLSTVWYMGKELRQAQWIVLTIMWVWSATTTTALLHYLGEHSLAILVIVFLFCICAVSLMVISFVGIYKRPDPKIWRYVQRFRLFEAACLFVDVEPEFSVVQRPGPARAWFLVLEEAWSDGELEHISSDEPHARITTRESLRLLLLKRNIKQPIFLADV